MSLFQSPKKRALLTSAIVAVTAVLSGVILYEVVIAKNYLGEVGLAGIFFASLLSHLTVVGRDIFVPTFLPLTVSYHPLLLGSVAGWGGAVGELTTYYWGVGIKEAMKGAGAKSASFGWIERYGLLAILLVAASPLPDTPIILLAGSAQFPISKLLIVEGVGKTLWYTLGAILGGVLFANLTDIVGNTVASSIIIVASTIFCIVVTLEKTRKTIFDLVRKVVG